MAYIERRREDQAEGTIPMDIGSQEEEDHSYCGPEYHHWGGAEDPHAAEEEAGPHPS